MPDSTGFQIEIFRRSDGTEIIEPVVKIYYVMEGEVILKLREGDASEKVFPMKREDLLLVNMMEPHALTIHQEGIVCAVSISYELIARFAGETQVVFSLNSMELPGRPYQDFRDFFHELIYIEVFENEKGRCRKESLLYELLDTLLISCTETPGSPEMEALQKGSPAAGSEQAEPSAAGSGQTEPPAAGSGQTEPSAAGSGQTEPSAAGSEQTKLSSARIWRVLSYIFANYQDPVSLRELAASMYVSTSTLSRLFRKQTGYYFADYLNLIRLIHATNELSGTSKSITRIAVECGFSNAPAFSARFHERYGKSPAEYRKQQAALKREQERERALLREELAGRMDRRREDRQDRKARPNIKIVDVTQKKQWGQPWNVVLNMSSLSALTRANMQYHMLFLTRELHMTHVKIWSVFARDLRITDGKTRGSYNYSMVDAVLDVLVENQLAVYFDFGSRTNIVLGQGDSALLKEEEGIAFASRAIWEDLFEDFIKHLVRRYGRKEIGRWIFDFCIDPTFLGSSAYYEDANYDYQNVFEFAWKTIRRLAPEAKVGGPVGLPNSPGREIEIFLQKCKSSGCMPDFISLPIFPYEPKPEQRTFVRNPDPDYDLRQLRMVKEMIRQICGEEIPIYVSDWNISVSNRNALNDSCMRGAYLCSRARWLAGYADICCVWIASDWVSNYYDNRSILKGGGGLLTQDNIRKPAYYALSFLGALGETLLYEDEDMVVTMRDPQNIMILCANRVRFHVGYYMREESEVTPENMDTTFVSDPARALELQLQGLEEGQEYVMKARSVSQKYGSVLDEWKRLGYENRLEREDIKYLREICVPHLTMERGMVSGGSLHCHILLDEQEFQLIHIYKAEK